MKHSHTLLLNKKTVSSNILLALIMLLITAISPTLTACSNPSATTTVTDFKLNTYVSITAYGSSSQSVLQECLALCDTYENMFSRTKASSLLSKVNNHQIVEIPSELAELIQYGIDYSTLSNGAFDLTIGSVSSLWDFTANDPQVPDNSSITEALSYVNYRNITLTPKEGSSDTYMIDIPEGTIIDLGAVAKGYIADKMKAYLLSHNIKSAIINLGGNVLCVGTKPSKSNYTVGVKKPFTEDGETLVSLSIADKSVVSSGTYERYFTENDILYHHILNPSTGYPYDNGLVDVTIISDSSVEGDCLSTTCFTLGLENGLALIESLDGIEAIFVTSDGQIHYSSGAKQFVI